MNQLNLKFESNINQDISSWNRESCIGQLFICFKHIKIKSYLASYAITSAQQILSNLRGHTARGSAHRVPENMGSPLVCNLGYSFWTSFCQAGALFFLHVVLQKIVRWLQQTTKMMKRRKKKRSKRKVLKNFRWSTLTSQSINGHLVKQFKLA